MTMALTVYSTEFAQYQHFMELRRRKRWHIPLGVQKPRGGYNFRIKPKEGLWINYRLRLAGIRQTDLANQLGVSTASMAQVLYGKRKSTRIETALYQALGFPSFEAMIAAARGKGAV